MRVKELLHIGAGALPSNFNNPRREASILLAAAMQVDEITLRLDATALVPEEIETLFRSWIERRAQGEPAQHLIGWCDFWGRRFEVSPDVLVPRPETEFLIEAVLTLALPETARVVDLGTGSGCIALTLKAERTSWQVAGVDLSLKALHLAGWNQERLNLNIELVNSDLSSALCSGWDLVTANLPYIPSATIASLTPEVQYDPLLALDGGQDGLDLVRRLLLDLSRLLSPGAWCALELGENQANTVVSIALSLGLEEWTRIVDLGGCERILILRSTAH
jgi:release factor glutamine methyltransferase